MRGSAATATAAVLARPISRPTAATAAAATIATAATRATTTTAATATATTTATTRRRRLDLLEDVIDERRRLVAHELGQALLARLAQLVVAGVALQQRDDVVGQRGGVGVAHVGQLARQEAPQRFGDVTVEHHSLSDCVLQLSVVAVVVIRHF
jgi:hypothetical protein